MKLLSVSTFVCVKVHDFQLLCCKLCVDNCVENIDSLKCQRKAIVLKKEEDIFRERTPQDLEEGIRLSDLNLSSVK